MDKLIIRKIPPTFKFYESIFFELILSNKRYNLNVNYSPFKNCQIFSIGGISSIIDNNRNDVNTCINIIKKINDLIDFQNKSTCIIDISSVSFDIIKNEKWIKNSMPYINETGNPMVIVLVRASTKMENK